MTTGICSRLVIRNTFLMKLRRNFPMYEVATYLDSDKHYIEIILKQQAFEHILKIPIAYDDHYAYIVQHYPELFI